MYSTLSSSSSSESSVDSYDRRRRHNRRPHRSNSGKGIHSKFEDDVVPRYSKEAKKLSPLLMRLASDDTSRSYKKKHSSRGSSAPRNEVAAMKRQHQKEFKNLLKILEKETSLLSDMEDEKKEELYELKRQHEKEVKKLFKFLETELTVVTEKYTMKNADLEERLERTQIEAQQQLRRYKEHALALEEELRATSQKAVYEVRQLKDELNGSVRQTSALETEIQTLREQLAEKDKRVRQLEGAKAKSSCVEDGLRDDLRRRDDEIKRKEMMIVRKDEEIRSWSSRRSAPSNRQENVDININGYEWEDTSGLTLSSDFGDKSPLKHGHAVYAPVSERRGSNTTSSSKRRDMRDDFDTRKLSVSFSDEVEKRILPMSAHDNLSKRLEKMYMDR